MRAVEIEKIANKINLLWGGCVAFMAAIFGEYWFLFAAFLVFNTVDYITGIIKAKIAKTENSNKGRMGIIKKTGYWIVIGIAFFIGFAFGEMGEKIGVDLSFTTMFGWLTLATFLINEIRSILENLVIIGVKVPGWLIKGLEVAAKTVESKGEQDVGN